jgi:dihydropteroate synthase
VADALCEKVARAEARGVPQARLLVDPGFGFGKTTGQSLFLLRHLRALRSAVGRPLLVGTSRKGFVGQAAGIASPADRDRATAASVALAIAGGASVVRVHDAAACRDAVKLSDAVATAHEGGAFFDAE